jgi:hypothetical protein
VLYSLYFESVETQDRKVFQLNSLDVNKNVSGLATYKYVLKCGVEILNLVATKFNGIVMSVVIVLL